MMHLEMEMNENKVWKKLEEICFIKFPTRIFYKLPNLAFLYVSCIKTPESVTR